MCVLFCTLLPHMITRTGRALNSSNAARITPVIITTAEILECAREIQLREAELRHIRFDSRDTLM